MHQKNVQGDNWLSGAKGRDDVVPSANCERDSKEIAASGCSGSAQEQPPRHKELDYGYKRSKLNTDLEMQDTTHEKKTSATKWYTSPCTAGSCRFAPRLCTHCTNEIVHIDAAHSAVFDLTRTSYQCMHTSSNIEHVRAC
jgi:hypothetical protein